MLGRRKLRTAALLPTMLCLVAMLMTACGAGGNNTSTTKAAANKQVLISTTVGAGESDIATFDPALDNDLYSGIAIGDVFTGLVSLNDQGQVQPQLAQSYDVSSNHLDYTFHLRPNLKFSDGTPLTASDVAYSINRALAPATASSTGPYYLRYIKDAAALNSGKIKTLIGDSLIVENPTTIEIIASSPVAFFLDTLTYVCADVVEPSLIQKYGSQWTNHLTAGGGDGPFEVKAWEHNKQIDLVPNPTWYGPKVQLKELIYPFYQSQDATYADFQAGKLDDATVPLANVSSVQNSPDYFKYPELSINYYAMNYDIKPFDNIDIRQAFELAINKQQIVSQIWKNTFIATNHIIPQGQPGYDPSLKGPDGTTSLTGDPTLAKQLLQEGMKQEGWTSVKQIPQITLTYSSAGNQATVNEVSQLLQDWKDVLGINVNTSDIELNTIFKYEAEGAKNPMMFYSGPGWIADYPDPEDWTTLQFSQGSAQNGMNYGQNNSTDAAAQVANQNLMAQADADQNPTTRMADYNKIEQQLVNDVAWMPMEQQEAFGVRKPCVQGWTNSSTGIMPANDWGKVYISTATCANTTSYS
ncbi:MAG TPA: peptide ABC transporter substrate-binding protein [Dictyobacter sp.]|jgi:peptide/nickel transport system substrate-binding protein/oligopeptide transport system substrate-binding protein|nr:peptide ABC transporter substrate-binding protein [Dictyobacter sp.]